MADDDLLVRDAQAHAARKVVGLEEVLQSLRQGGDVGHLAVGDDARGELDAGRTDHAVVVRLHRRQEASVEVEADRAAIRVLTER